MNKGLRIGSLSVRLDVVRQTKHIGVNSLLGDGRHFLLWDFDNSHHDGVFLELERIQRKHYLPPVHVVYAGKPGSYHAYCFASKPWPDVVRIILETEGVDRNFVLLALARGYFTLRITNKRSRYFKPAGQLWSPVLPDLTHDQVPSFAEYWTGKR